MENTIMTLLLALGLSAACGFRVFVPLLVTCLAARAGHLSLAPGFQWLAGDTALITFAAATVLEVGAYYIPWVDNLLDAAATPAAVIAGTVITASMFTDMSPFLKWSMAAIAGGGVAAVVQGVTVAVRGGSLLATAGAANPFISTMELFGSITASVLAIAVPIAGILLIVALLAFGARRFLFRHGAAPQLPAA